jgi:hypothetical protein
VKSIIGRRSLFFLLMAAVCLALLGPTPSEFRWVNLAAAGVATFWAVMMAGEDLARRRRARSRRPPPPAA